MTGRARTQSRLPKITRPRYPHLGYSQESTKPKCNGKASSRGNRLHDHGSPYARMPAWGIGVLASRLIKRDLSVLKYVLNHMFHKYLLLTNIGISGVLSLTGDVIQQHYEVISDSERKWDKSRSLRMTSSGITVGFVCHYWYCFLDKKFPGKNFKTVMKKVVIDQLVCSPAYITVFFATTCFMEGKNLKQFKNEVVEKGWRLFLADCIVWPPAQVINFYFLSPRYRVLYDNMISLGCDIYTSYVKNEIPMKNIDKDD